MGTAIYTERALIYAYKTRDAEMCGLDPKQISLAYQVDQPFNPHQCDFGRDFTAAMLKDFKTRGGTIHIIEREDQLILPLDEHKVLVPVPQPLLKDWGLADLVG